LPSDRPKPAQIAGLSNFKLRFCTNQYFRLKLEQHTVATAPPGRSMTLHSYRSRHLAADVLIGGLTCYDEAMANVARDAMANADVPELTPICLTEELDVDREVTAFCIRIRRTRFSALTAMSYGFDVEVFARYLKTVGRTLSTATTNDFFNYRRQRLEGPINLRLSPPSWNRAVEALVEVKKLFKLDLPDVTRRALRASDGRDDQITMVSYDDYLLFRNEGLAGPRETQRNRAFSEFAVTTGLRCNEIGHLLLIELPALSTFGDLKSKELRIPGVIAKRGKSRTVYYSKRVSRDYVERYIAEDRADRAYRMIQRTFPNRRYSLSELRRYSTYIFFERNKSGTLRIIAGEAPEGVIPVSKLSQEERRKLIEVVPRGPTHFEVVNIGSLWLTDRGTQPTSQSWRAVFKSACEGLTNSLGEELHIRPHTLRHTYAVHYLNLMLQGYITLAIRRRGDLSPEAESARRLIGYPLRHLQLRLGHSDINQTLKYSRYLDENRAMIDLVIDRWNMHLA